MSDGRNEGGAPWRFRRRLALGVLIYCGAAAAYVLTQGPEMAAAALGPLGIPVSAVLGSYFVAAVYEDTRRA